MKITKSQYNDYSRMANASNNVNKCVADLNAHIQFLQRTNNVEALEKLNSKLTIFLDTIILNFVDSLPDTNEKE